MLTTSLKFNNVEVYEKALNEKKHEEVLHSIFRLTTKLVYDKRLINNFNQLPQLDNIIQNVGLKIFDESHHDFNESERNTSVFICTEIYSTGGHTRILEDIISKLSGPSAIILTDIFDRYATGKLNFNYTVKNLKNTSIIALPKMSLVDKVRNLYDVLKTIKAKSITLIAHHQDVIAYSSCNSRVKIPQLFIHHADHNPTLGATIKHYKHIDLNNALYRLCQDAGEVQPYILPMTSKKQFKNYVHKSNYSTATSGSFNKFCTYGELSFANIVKTILTSSTGNHYHIGSIPDEYLKYIDIALTTAGIDSYRFKYLGNVNSLTDALLKNDVDIYITSAPTGGGKAFVDATSCGIAIFRFTVPHETQRIQKYIENYFYPNNLPTWSNLTELSNNFNNYNISELFNISRINYDKIYNTDNFIVKLEHIYNF